MSATWFTADLHLGHRLVADLRGFASAAEHDDAIAQSWAGQVGAADIVWVLGDLAVSSPTYALSVIARLPGRKRLIAGNHDPAHPMHRDAHRWHRAYGDVFELVAPFARRRLDGENVLLSHFPYERDRAVARYQQYRLPDLGLPLIHGHTHGGEQLSVTALGTLEIHVGLDAWDYRLVSESTVVGLLRAARPANDLARKAHTG